MIIDEQAVNQGSARHDPDNFDIRGTLLSISRAFKNHKLLVLITCALTMVGVTVYVWIWPPTYMVQTMMMVERDTDPVRDTFYLGWNTFRKDDSRSEIEMLTSGPVIQKVVEQQHLTYDDVYHPFLSHVVYLWQSSAVGKAYKNLKNSLLHKTEDPSTRKARELGRTMVDMRAGISVDPIAESNVGRITVKGPNQKVSIIANQLLEVYLADRRERYESEAHKAYEILSEEAARTGKELSDITARRLAFMKANGLSFDLQKENLDLTRLSQAEDAIAITKSKIATMGASLHEIDNQIASEPTTRTTSTMFELNSLRESTKMKRLELQTLLLETRTRYREDSPEVQELKDGIAKLDAMIAQTSEKVQRSTSEGLSSVYQELLSKKHTTEADLLGAKAGLAEMEQTADALRSRLALVPSLQAQLRKLDRDYSLSQEVYQQLVAKQTQALVSVSTAKVAMSSMRVVEYATPPLEPTWPKTKILYPVALLIAAIFAVGTGMIIDHMRARIRREDVVRGRGNAPLYGTISVAGEARPFTIIGRNSAKSASGASG